MHVTAGDFDLELPDGFGPRVLGLRWRNSPEIFAQLGDDVALGDYRFRGGHRLWAGPEIPVVTYALDDQPCRVVDGVIEGPIDSASLQKTIRVSEDSGHLVVAHQITNHGSTPIEVACWAITQFPLGGVATIPIGPQANGLQADRSVVLWPYTDLTDPRVQIGPDQIEIRADAGSALKIGFGPNPGWLTYELGDYRFRKTVTPDEGEVYPDRRAVAQVFVERHFCELETVGPMRLLEPGESTQHQEVWSVGTV